MDPSAIREQIDKILHSQSFATKGQLRKLLEILHKNMDSQLTLTPHQVIQELWPEETRTKRSTAVATEINRLRHALESYYNGEGKTDPVTIVLPNRAVPAPDGTPEKRWMVAEPRGSSADHPAVPLFNLRRGPLYFFTAGNDGATPSGVIFDSQGNLYGTTFSGGSSGNGVVFELSPPSSGSGPWTLTVLSPITAGANPVAGVIFDSKGNLYGTTLNQPGAVYELSPPTSGSGTWTETALLFFNGGSNGGAPYGGVIFDSKGDLYGSTLLGGDLTDCSTAGCGVVYELSPPSSGNGPWTETVLYTFTGRGDGGNPVGELVFDSKGNLYGTTSAGGNTSACQSSATGAPGCGVVFELSPPSSGSGPWTETVLHAFGGSDGAVPFAGLVFNSVGNLYGTTRSGGSMPACLYLPGYPPGCGVVFELSPPSSGTGPWTETVLHSFTDSNDGGFPSAALSFDSTGRLYGTTYEGGPIGAGLVFELNPPSGGSDPWTETVLYTFTSTTDGASPSSNVIFDSKGNLYGSIGHVGGVYELSPAAATPVFSLPAGTYSSPQTVTISDATPGATIYYTTDGTTPTTASTVYTMALTVSTQEVLQAIAAASGLANSAVASASYTIAPAAPTPTFSPAPGTYTSAQTVTIFDAAAGAAIYYTTDKSTPTTASTKYTGPITINSTETIEAIATASGYSSSALATANYTITVPLASVSLASLTFGAQIVTTSSAAQTVTLSNGGNASLNISSIAANANFTQTNSCGTSLAANNSCAISVTFMPTTSGALSGTLTITDNADGVGGSTQTVALSGTGQDFSFGPASGSSTSATVAPGQTATYTLSLAGQGGLSGTIGFTITGAPSESTCTASPNPASLGTNATVSCTTTAPSLILPRHRPLPPPLPRPMPWSGLWILALLLMSLAWTRMRRQLAARRWASILLVLGVGLLLTRALAGCGGGGGTAVSNPGTPAGNYSLTVTGTAGSGSSSVSHSVTLTLTVT